GCVGHPIFDFMNKLGEAGLYGPPSDEAPWSLTILRRFLIVMRGIQMTNLVASKEVQTLLDRASGICEAGGNARLKAIMRDFLESTMSLIESMTSPRANSGRRSTICRIARRNSNSSSQGLASNIFSIFTWMQRMRLQACRMAHRGRSRGRST